MGLVALIGVAVVFWVLAFVTKRRFGVLGLALAAGALLSSLWSQELIGIVNRSGLELASISTAGFISIVMVLAPAFLLLFSGPSYRNTRGRVVGAVLFAIFAAALIAEPLSSALVLDQAGRAVFDTVARYQVVIVTAGVLIALLDMLAVHTISGSRSKSKH
jgi:hypothetical protein